jgi:predicted XRE-type DNA-binding protein
MGRNMLSKAKLSNQMQAQRNLKPVKFENLWFALEKMEADAVNMHMRSELMTFIERVIQKWNLPQAEASARLGLTRPRLNDLLRGKISKFSLDALASIATRAGLSVKLSVKKAGMKRAA